MWCRRRSEGAPEPLLVEAIPQLPRKTADTTCAVRFLVGFYDGWNRSQPDAASGRNLIRHARRGNESAERVYDVQDRVDLIVERS
jgi:hypothetical protein